MSNGSPIGKASADTMALVAVFCEGDNFIEHSDIRRVLGIPDGAELPYSAISSARRIVMRDNGHVYDPVPGRGYKLLNDDEIVESGDSTLRVIQNRSRKMRERFSHIKNFDELTPERKNEALVKASLAAMYEESAKRKSRKKLQKAIATSKSRSELPTGRTLEVLRGD